MDTSIIEIIETDITENKTEIKTTDIIDDNICVICIDNIDITNSDTSKIDCNHIFHKSCIDEWLNINQKCPICIRNIVDYKSSIVKNNNITINNRQNRQNNNITKCVFTCTCLLFMPIIIVSIINLLHFPMTVNFINSNYVEKNITNFTNSCVNKTDIENKKYSNIFKTDESYWINLVYILYTCGSVVLISSIKKFIYFATAYYLPFIGWYSYFIINYLRIFNYLDKMLETFCDDNFLNIYSIKSSSTVIFFLISILYGLVFIMLTCGYYNYNKIRINPQ